MAGMRTSSRSNTCPTAWSASWGLSLVIVLLANLSPSSSRAAADTVGASPPRLELSACRLKGVAHEARCGVLKRPLNPAEPAGPQIDVHVAVLPALAAAAYAAQATAVHGALLDGHDGPRGGMLASLIDVQLKFAAFPAAAGELSVMAQLLSRSQAGCLYSFEVSDAQQGIASGRLMVAFAKDAA